MNRPLALSAFALALICVGCDAPDPAVPLPPPKIERTMLKHLIPASAKKCADEPDGSKAESAADGAEYIEDLRAAGADCRRKVKFLAGQIDNEAE